MSGLKLVESIRSSTAKKHTLLSWVTLQLDEVKAEGEVVEGDQHYQQISEVCDELDSFIRYNAGLSEEEQLDSHSIFVTFSHLYTLCLVRLEKTRPGKIFDGAELAAKVLAEEDVSIEVVDTDKKKKKKASKKRSYVRSAAKEMACIVLIQLFETFNQQLSSLAPLLFGIIFKNFKKIMEKSKYAHAAFSTSLMQLTNAVIKSGGGSSFYHEYFPKFSKLSKKVFEAICTDRQDFSTDMVSAIMEIWSLHYRRDSFMKDNRNNLENAILASYCEGELGTLGFVNDFSRPVIARTLAEVLFHYKGSETLNIEQVIHLYAALFQRSTTRDAQAGTFESIVHFIGLCLSVDGNFLEGSRYLEIVRSLAREIFSPSQTGNQSMDDLSRNLRYFASMHEIFLPRIGESSKNLIVLQLLDSDENSNGSTSNHIDSDPEKLWFSLAQLDLARLLLLELSSSFGNERHLVDQIRRTLIDLSTCENFTLRIHANEVLRLFLSSFPQFLSETIEGSLGALSKSFKQDDDFVFAANHGHALVVANLIACADKDYVSFELIMRITVFATSFIKNHTTTTVAPLYSKGLLCWVLLIGCMNYKDDRYLQMQSSQLFLFWKVLLTHNYSSREEDDLYRNLEIRNHALTCLLSFLGNVSVGSKDVAKQVSYLLTKCSNFNHSITQKSRKIDKALLTNELRLLQIHLRLHKYIKDDFNSSLLILIMKNFSDPNLYSEGSHSLMETLVGDGKRVLSSEQSLNSRQPSVAAVLGQNDGFAYGISSKLSGINVSELFIKGQSENKHFPSFDVKEWSWMCEFEREVSRPITCMLSVDYFVTLYCPEGYSTSDRYSPRVTTALIDASMEIFSLKFPYLNDKIQYSIIESLNSSMFCRTTTPMRNIAIAVNTLTSLNQGLRIMHEEGLPLEYSVGELLLKSIDKIKFDNDTYLTDLKAECIGLVCGTVNKCTDEDKPEKDMVSEQVNISIKCLVDVEEPFMRILRALSLVYIYRYSPASAPFGRIFDVIITLVNDPHPVVHSWSLKAMNLLIEKHTTMDHSTASILLECLEDISTNPSYGMYGSSVLRYNYCMEIDSQLVVGQILRSLTETFGPCISELADGTSGRFKSLTYGLVLSNKIAHQMLALEIYGNLVIFKNQNSLEHPIFINVAKSIVNGAIIPGISSTISNCGLVRKNESIFNSCSLLGVMRCFDLFSLLMRLQKGSMFAHELEISGWRWLSLSPSSEALHAYLFSWMDQTLGDEIRWFEKLYQIFNVSEWRLFMGYYKSSKSLLKKSGFENYDDDTIPAEEEKSITQNKSLESNTDSRNSSDLLPWRARLWILRMVKHLCISSLKNDESSLVLTQKIPELIRLSFQASTSSVASVKSLGLDLLRLVLKSNSSSQLSRGGLSELEQQEAQIVSAMMPAFSSGTPPEIVVSAIDLSAEILTSGISTVGRMQRVSQLLIQYLGVFNENKSSVKLGDVLIVTQKSKKKIELSILGAWAELVQKSLATDGEDLREFTESYWDILVPLWIMSLREYAMVKYEGKRSDKLVEGQIKESFFEEGKLELFEGIWLNMVVALSCVLEASPEVVLRRLNETETESFMLILFIQCIEIVVKSIDNHKTTMKVLPALNNLLRCCVPLDPLFEDGTNEEIVGILDRIITTGNNNEKRIVVQIINDLIVRYMKKNNSHDLFLQGIDKLYELLRLLLKPISQLLPFIRYNSLHEEVLEKLTLQDDEVILLRECFSVLETNVGKFDDVFKVDLYSCLLFIMGEIFQSDTREEIVPIVLPLLRSVSSNIVARSLNDCLIKIFFDSIKGVLFEKLQLLNQLATCFILLASNYPCFTETDLRTFVTIIMSGLRDSDTQSITMHGLTSLIRKDNQQNPSRYIIKSLILEISDSLGSEDSQTANLMLDFVLCFVKRIQGVDPASGPASMALMLSMEIAYSEKVGVINEKSGSRVLSLIAIDKDSFKSASSGLLSEKQRKQLEKIIESSPEFNNGKNSERKSDLLLKNFM